MYKFVKAKLNTALRLCVYVFIIQVPPSLSLVVGPLPTNHLSPEAGSDRKRPSQRGTPVGGTQRDDAAAGTDGGLNHRGGAGHAGAHGGDH